MTLAIGMRYQGGVILAADTRLSYGAGQPVSEGSKMIGDQAGKCNFVIAQCTDDVYAASTVMEDIRAKLKSEKPETLSKLETAIKQALWEGYAPVHDNRPDIQLLLAAFVGDEPALYFCSPPSTVSPLWGNYHAIGEARPISSEIGKWFETRTDWTAHERLCQLSYIMYRAKLLQPDSVGGHTDVAVLSNWEDVPLWIEHLSMDVAESHGMAFDRHLAELACMAVGGKAKGTEEIIKTAESLYSCSLLYARAEFRCQFPDKTIRRQCYT